MCVNVYAGITWFGVTKLHIVAGSSRHTTQYKNLKGVPAKNITRHEYVDVLKDTLLPEGQRIFRSHNMASWTLQQDNDPTHGIASTVLQQFNETHNSNISLLDGWPPSSPDLSPIENLWALIDAKMQEKACKSFDEFKEALQKEWSLVSKCTILSLMSSVKRRIEKCIALKGDLTKY
jgi:hypothetical protein